MIDSCGDSPWYTFEPQSWSEHCIEEKNIPGIESLLNQLISPLEASYQYCIIEDDTGAFYKYLFQSNLSF
jgi:hypothetical protein